MQINTFVREKPKDVYIGTAVTTSSYAEFKEDRIVLMNTLSPKNPIQPDAPKSKFNITIPYVEISSMRYCFDSEISIVLIQPIHHSYLSLCGFTKQTPEKFVPENFIMVTFSKVIERDQLIHIKGFARSANKVIKIIEVNPVYATRYLKSLNGSNRRQTSSNNLSQSQPIETINLSESEEEDGDATSVNDTSLLGKVIVKYPENETNQILLYGKDLSCIGEGKYLNDNIMNFYLKFSTYRNVDYNGRDYALNALDDKIFIYDALFSPYLFSSNRKRKLHQTNLKGYSVYSVENFADFYKRNLQKWTRDVDIFTKDFLIMPLLKDNHWFLAIICYPGNLMPPNRKSTDLSPEYAKEKASIILMDSLNTYFPKNEITRDIFKYLNMEYKEKRKPSDANDQLSRQKFVELFPDVPLQTNYYDCGLFVLEYITRFLNSPQATFYTIRTDPKSLAKWFSPESLADKRARIKLAVMNQMEPSVAAELQRELEEEERMAASEELDISYPSLSLNGNGGPT